MEGQKPKKPNIDTLMEKYPRHPQHLISLLQDVQAAFNYISPENLNLVCDYVGVPITQAWSIATFYKSFSLEPRGEHEIKVCLGTACHVRGGSRILNWMEHKLHVKAGETTPDGQFSLEQVACFGCCALAPVVVVDSDVHARMNSTKGQKLLKKYES